MTSQLNVDTISAKNGTSPVTLTKQDAVKTWNTLDGTGDYGLHFTNNMGNATYAVTFGLDDDGSSSVVLNADTSNGTMAAGSFDFESYYVNSTNNRTNYDYANIYIVVHGDLA